MKKLIRTMFVLLLTLVSTALFACEQDEEPVFSAEDAIKVLLVEQETYVAGDFDVPGKLHYKGTDYALSWASDNTCLAVSAELNANGNYTIVATRPEEGKQTATLTASLKIGETTATKAFSFNLYPIDVYEISDAYKFEYANKTAKESFDLDAEFTYEGKTATIEWSVPTEYAEIIKVENGQLVFDAVTVDTPVQVIATFTYNNQTAIRPFNFTLISPIEPPVTVTQFADGDTFKLGLYQEGLGTYLYFAGKAAGYYLATTEEGKDATDVTIHVVEGGYHLSFVDAEGATKYLECVAGTKVNASIVDAPTKAWSFNEDYATFTQELSAEEAGTNAGTYYIGTYNTYNTISASKISYAATSYPAHMYILPYGPVANPVAGVTYKFALYQEGLGSTLYFAGKASGYYLATTEDPNEAVDVTVVAVEGGYHLSFVDAEGATKYLECVAGTKVNASIVDAPTKVWSFNKEHYTFTQELSAEEAGDSNAGTYYMGTYNTYNTISASKISYAATSYPCRMYAPGSDLPKPVEMTITEALAAEDGTMVIVTGTVKSIDSAWDSGYGNMCVTIEDAAGKTLYVYRLKTQVAVGDKIVINGKVGSHNGSKQIAAGATAEIIANGGGETPTPDPNPGVTTEFTTTPFSSVAGLVPSAGATAEPIYIIGTVTKVEAWKNSVFLQDDAGNTMEAFQARSFDGILTPSELNISAGSVVVIKGTPDEYNGTPQLSNPTIVQIGNVVCTATDAHKVAVTVKEISLSTTANDNFTLPIVGSTYNDVVISWVSNNAAIAINGANATVTKGDAAVEVTLTATYTLNEATATKSHAINVPNNAPLLETATIVLSGHTLSSNAAKDGDVTTYFKVSSPADLLLGTYLSCTVNKNGGTGFGFYANYRVYAKAELTIAAAEGYVIKSITLANCTSKESGATAAGTVTGVDGTLNLTWTKQNVSATYDEGINEVLISCSTGQFRFDSITIVVEKVSA